MAYTEGKWERRGAQVFVSNIKSCIAIACCTRKIKDPIANAALIAGAPGLLKACKEALTNLDNNSKNPIGLTLDESVLYKHLQQAINDAVNI